MVHSKNDVVLHTAHYTFYLSRAVTFYNPIITYTASDCLSATALYYHVHSVVIIIITIRDPYFVCAAAASPQNRIIRALVFETSNAGPVF